MSENRDPEYARNPPEIAGRATPDDLFARLRDLGLETATIEHPPVFTVEESKRLRGELPGGHCKNLYLRDRKKRDYLVVALEDTPVDLKALSRTIGAPGLTFGRAERLIEVLGVIPGAVTPFAVVNDPDRAVRVVLERRMLEIDPLNFHPLRNHLTTAIRPDDLTAFLDAAGHAPLILDL